MSIKIVSDDLIIIDNTPYLAKENLGRRGQFWLRNYDNNSIRIEYDMPIQRGVPCRFDVHFENAANLTLQRISFTKNFEHNYRLPSRQLAPVDELAALDLKETKLDVGQSKTFSLNVTFPAAGEHAYYINVMIDGETQSWDKREVCMFHIVEK
jgi:hypothetical protein